VYDCYTGKDKTDLVSVNTGKGLKETDFFFPLALQPPLGVVFYSPLAGFSLLAYEVT